MNIVPRTSDYADAISISNLRYSVGYSSDLILDNVNLSIPKGKIFGLLGPSGCGKTTLIRCIVGYLRPDCGEILLLGKSHSCDDLLIPGKNVGYMPQEGGLFDYMSISEILFYYGRLLLMDKFTIKQRIDELVDQLRLPPKIVKIDCLSGGQQRRVSVAIALIHCPPIIILDEPTTGVDPLLCEKIWKILVDLSVQQKTTIVITTHYIEEARKSDFVGFMRNGKILHQNTPKNLLRTFSSLEAAFFQLCLKDNVKLGESSHDQFVESNKIISQKNHSSFLKNFQTFLTIMCTLFLRYFKFDLFSGLSLFHTYLLPLNTSLLVAYCFGGQVFGLAIGLVNNEVDPQLSSRFVSTLDSRIINIHYYHHVEDALKDVEGKKLLAIIVFQNGFSEAFLERIYRSDMMSNSAINRSCIHIHADTTEKVAYQSFIGLLHSQIKNFTRNLILNSSQKHLNIENSNFIANWPIKMDQIIYGHYYANGFTLRDNIYPAIIVNNVYFVGFSFFVISLISERISQSYERNFVAGVKNYQILFAQAISRTIIMIPMFFLLVYVPIEVFRFPVSFKSVIQSLPLILMVNITGLASSLVVAVCCNSLAPATFIITGHYFYIIFGSGSIWPLESVNYYLRQLLILGPTSMAIRALRNIFYKNAHSFHNDSIKALLIMLGWTLVSLIIGIKFFRR